MSVPARESRHVPAPAPRRAPVSHPRLRPAPRLTPQRKRRPAFHPGFLFFSTVVITLVVTGVVVLNVLLAQQAFQVRTLREEITGLRGKQVDLIEHAAALSAPGRIQTWATDHGMVTPPDTFVLAIPGTSGAAASGGHP